MFRFRGTWIGGKSVEGEFSWDDGTDASEWLKENYDVSTEKSFILITNYLNDLIPLSMQIHINLADLEDHFFQIHCHQIFQSLNIFI